MKITLSANAGVSVDFAGKRIWVDALHERKVLGFSSVTLDLYKQLLQHDAFRSPDVICYTHCHPDHFSKRMTLDAAAHWPNVQVISPESMAEGWTMVENDHWEMSVGNLNISYIRLPHEGDAYANAIHYGMILSDGVQNILIPGDCCLCSTVLADAVKNMHFDVVLLDFPWITLPKARAFLDKYICTEKICVYHLPFEEDDVNNYRSAAIHVAKLYAGRASLLMEPFQTVEY